MNKSDLYSQNLDDIVWIKSRRSHQGSVNCVEIARIEGGIAVRDSKNPDLPALRFTDAEYAAFVGGIQDGQENLLP